METNFGVGGHNQSGVRYIFSQCYTSYFLTMFAHLWWFWGKGFGVAVLDWVFGVGIFN